MSAEWTRHSLVAAGLLAAFALAGGAMVAFTHRFTADEIEAQQNAAVRERLTSILPASAYDNDIARDTTTVIAPEALGSDEPLTVYRARQDGAPVAAVLTVIAPNGYNGAIRLLVGVRFDGTLAGVRVIRHQETPGLGDAIEADKSDWTEQFPGRSLGDPPTEDWAVAKDGGAFDQITGATITPRAVVQAVRRALVYFRAHRDELFTRQEAGTGPADDAVRS
ncbi:electron transport complex subunit RsxG [Arhodomonas sp. AD133]|uniref:electron transport complex subunit RsxG n=1 Tax=Arhodomonas sp. AD133 TaxID=3415009 RepID=UPI003EBB4237